ncbi:MAG: hypothetical protein OHK0029_14460 [Armatimonadaceae bacterium]
MLPNLPPGFLDSSSSPGMFPRRYVCRRAPAPVRIDGKLDKPVWRDAPWTEFFVDIEGNKKPNPRWRTRAKMLWDDQYFYVGAYLEEPHLVATLTEHDAVIWHDNDFEVFIDPDGDRKMYYEWEVNALGTIFDLLLERTYKDGGPARHEWQLPGMRHAVQLYGTLNDPRDTDTGWSVEWAFPWKSLAEKAGAMACPPQDGDVWRVNFSRVQWRYRVENGKYIKEEGREDNWVWSPQGEINMHAPEKWGYVEFRRR